MSDREEQLHPLAWAMSAEMRNRWAIETVLKNSPDALTGGQLSRMAKGLAEFVRGGGYIIDDDIVFAAADKPKKVW